ncbi:hypothetical protein D9758_006050 [Tetrapyrgos nigripes]|uniref:Altered inheritance of mitochondria protein 6 n=1 Tax=Tetrapyrgos nigripes TaxID=182062 RepID=A0A8H5G0A1_9AGAR|nr:hypothetical protein D9758_006050 [Tetrapyrgos nigripes]
MIIRTWALSVIFAASRINATPVPAQKVHSHNDYLQTVPLFTALDNGVTSVEADLWLHDGNLFVAHKENEIDASKTFDSVYIQPLVKLIDEQTYGDLFTRDNPLQLLVDFKSDGDELSFSFSSHQTLFIFSFSSFSPILAALEPLRSKGYLTTFKDSVYTQSFVTAVGTGNTPLDKVLASNPRDLFFDAPLTDIAAKPPAEGLVWSKEIAPLASADLKDAVGILNWLAAQVGIVTSGTKNALNKLVGDAHQLDGVKSRLYGTPNLDCVTIAFIKEGLDWINADDLRHVKDLLGLKSRFLYNWRGCGCVW